MRIKSICVFAALAFSLAACNHWDHDWEHFKEQYADKGTTIRLNGLMKLGLQIFAKTDDDPQTRALLNIVRKMHGVEIHIIPRARAHYEPSEVGKLSERMGQSDYQSLINVRSGGQLVHLWACGTGRTY